MSENKPRIWKEGDRVVATYDPVTRTYKSWDPIFVIQAGNRYLGIPKQTYDILCRNECEKLIIYNGTGADRMEHVQRFAQFSRSCRPVETDMRRKIVVTHSGLWSMSPAPTRAALAQQAAQAQPSLL